MVSKFSKRNVDITLKENIENINTFEDTKYLVKTTESMEYYKVKKEVESLRK